MGKKKTLLGKYHVNQKLPPQNNISVAVSVLCMLLFWNQNSWRAQREQKLSQLIIQNNTTRKTGLWYDV